ncbi:hypothetical protein CEPID_12245 [Corynebacterium epidermidicanis]|uniref:Uncharacterized protein n=2 Tax=Corynebacterium epidermidicanis TaxID=1050174 RepID=A0A0G3GZM6_9CORY|nr:hypothetical protein CEPID_12245 [Corynebacterium epidermidicanis]
MVFQGLALWPHMSVAKYIDFPLTTGDRRTQQESAPVTVDELVPKGYDTRILAHVHQPLSLTTKPPNFWPGQGMLRVIELPGLAFKEPEIPPALC